MVFTTRSLHWSSLRTKTSKDWECHCLFPEICKNKQQDKYHKAINSEAATPQVRTMVSKCFLVHILTTSNFSISINQPPGFSCWTRNHF